MRALEATTLSVGYTPIEEYWSYRRAGSGGHEEGRYHEDKDQFNFLKIGAGEGEMIL